MGPGTRIPAIIVSPFAKKGFVDHTPNDTTSILRFITNRFGLDTLPGIKARDEAMAKNGEPAARRPYRGARGHPGLRTQASSHRSRPAPSGSGTTYLLIFLNAARRGVAAIVPPRPLGRREEEDQPCRQPTS